MMLLNEAKIILDLCGGTGSWSKPYLKADYDVRNITLPEYNVIDYIPPKNVYGILAAPPCDQFSLARTTAKTERDFMKGMNPVNACIRIIWQSDPIFWALENPVGLLSKFIGKYRYIFDPWWFGDPWTKKTALWGKFTIPERIYFRKTDLMGSDEIKKCRINARKLSSISEITSGSQKEKRAITPQGFARAFFEANP